MPCGAPDAPRWLRRANAGTAGDGPASANPIWSVTHVSNTAPPTRTMPTSGPALWLMARLASGTPPNGKQNRNASATVCAAGRPITRHTPVGAIIAASPWKAAKIAAAAM